jgi:quercetin dioxygenase-like cupin family protein
MTTDTAIAPVLRARDEGVLLDHAGNLLDWRLQSADTGGAHAVMEAVMLAGMEPPIHIHTREDEIFHLIEGEVTFVAGGREARLGPGGTVFLPRGVAHGFRVEGGSARALVVMTPGGIEAGFHAGGTPTAERRIPSEPGHLDIDALDAAFAERGITTVGPPPSVPGWGAHMTA